jgi:HK97 family phage major capsid protein
MRTQVQHRKLFEMAARIPRGIETKEGPDLEAQIAAIKAEILTKIGGNVEQVKALQLQLDALDVKLAHQGGGFGGDGTFSKSTIDLLKENDSFARLMSDKRGKGVLVLTGADAANFLQRKTTITSTAVGAATSGVLQVGRLPEITTEARQQLTVRDLLTATPTTFQIVDFVKVNTPMAIASPVAEAAAKAENAVTFTTVSERVKTLATWIPASRQVLDDMSELAAFINSSLTYYLNQAEELELLSGDGTGEHLHGLIPQATAFSTSLLHAAQGWNKIDMIGRAIQQITAAKEMAPSFVTLHPTDWWDIRLTKDGFGRYVLGDPQQGSFTNTGFGVSSPTQNLFGLNVVPTVNITQGSFMVGSGSPVAAEIRDRLETVVEVSTEHQDFFTKNLVAVRAEKRLCLVVRRPASYVTGTFTTSP